MRRRNLDFIRELPLSEGCDQLWVVIDRFTKMAHFIPLREKMAADLAIIFAREIWKHHGLPTDIVSDRDSRFTSEVWQEFLRLSGIRPRMSTAFYPQRTDKRNDSTRPLRHTYECLLAENRMTGCPSYPWRSLPTITRSREEPG